MINYHMISLKDDDDVIKNDSKLYPQLFGNKHYMMNKHNSRYIKKRSKQRITVGLSPSNKIGWFASMKAL